MIDIYYIGGSPCSGKSTVVEVISQKYNLYYFKVDDFLDKYTEMGVEKGKPICIKQKSVTADQIWMNRDILFAEEVREQCNQMGYKAFVNDGSISIDELVKKVALQFGMKE